MASNLRRAGLEMLRQAEPELISLIGQQMSYRLPSDYISWKELESMIAVALETCDRRAMEAVNYTSFIHSHRVALWFMKKAPLYCITQDFFDVLDYTDVSDEAILKNWTPSLPTLLLTIPKGQLASPEGLVDYIVVHTSQKDRPLDEVGKWRKYEVRRLEPVFDLQIQFATCDRAGYVWSSGFGLSYGKIVSQGLNLGNQVMGECDRAFLNRMRNIVLNALLALDYQSDLVVDVSEDELEEETRGKGFVPKSEVPKYWLPRWLGKGYCRRSRVHRGRGACKRTHWRRGHWRHQKVGKGRSERKWVRVDPILINP